MYVKSKSRIYLHQTSLAQLRLLITIFECVCTLRIIINKKVLTTRLYLYRPCRGGMKRTAAGRHRLLTGPVALPITHKRTAAVVCQAGAQRTTAL